MPRNAIIDQIKDFVIKITPLKRMGEPLDIAKGVAFLASSDASFITGANLLIDGGILLNSPGDLNSALTKPFI